MMRNPLGANIAFKGFFYALKRPYSTSLVWVLIPTRFSTYLYICQIILSFYLVL